MDERETAWNELPIRHGEEGEQYQRLYYKYSHIGCPGAEYEDNCPTPWDCASKGMCYLIWKQRRIQWPV